MFSSGSRVGGFASTQWSVVVAAQSRGTAAGAEALATLCRRYWRPLYTFLRRRGLAAEDAQDLTQAYFARMMEKNFLGQVDPNLGRFRSFLLASLKHFLANEWDRERAQKRGGGVEFVSIDDLTGAEHDLARFAPAPTLTPEQLYDRNWAMTILANATARLEGEFSAAGKSHLFDALRVFLAGDRPGLKYADVAASLGISEGTVRVSVYRLRDRFRAVLRTEIAQTLANPSDPAAVDEELRYLLSVL